MNLKKEHSAFSKKSISQDLEREYSESASMQSIEKYIEGLYEEIPDKILSTGKLLNLSRVPENMKALLMNESLISALTRVLREDGKRSMELLTNIMYIFFCFSNYPQFHTFLTANKIGDMSLKIIDQEKIRYHLWLSDLKKSKNNCSSSENKIELEAQKRKFNSVIKRQDQLLFLTFNLLLNLADDLSIEVKMVKRELIPNLILILDRQATSADLVKLALIFLRKLSMIEENVDQILGYGDDIILQIEKLLSNSNEEYLDLCIRFILNLSFNAQFRILFSKSPILEHLVKIATSKTVQDSTLAFKALYQISIDDKLRSNHQFTECIPIIMTRILESKYENAPVEIMALAINISYVPRNAKLICGNNGLKFLVKKAIKTNEALMFKFLRVLSQHEESIKDFVDEFMNLILNQNVHPEILVEILGLLANLSIERFDFSKLVQRYDLLPFLSRILGESLIRNESCTVSENDDVKLEAIMLIGTMCLDMNIMPIMADLRIPILLIDFMSTKEEDDEMICQILYCINRFLYHESTKMQMIEKTNIVDYLVDLLYDKNSEIRRMADASLDIISDMNEKWTTKIRQQKFQWHNSEWLHLIAQEDLSANSALENDPNHYEELLLQKEKKWKCEKKKTILEKEILGEEEEENGSRLIIGGTSALLDGPLY